MHRPGNAGRGSPSSAAEAREAAQLRAVSGPLPSLRAEVEADGGGTGIAALARRLRSKLRRSPSSEPSTPAAGVPVANARVNWVLVDGRGIVPGTRSVMIALFGLGPQDQEAIVTRLMAVGAEDGPPLVPVFLTDVSDFTALRRHLALFEYLRLGNLPETGRGTGPPRRDRELYLARRFALLCAKWQPVRVVAFGPVAGRQLAAWRASPHLPESVRELLADVAGG